MKRFYIAIATVVVLLLLVNPIMSIVQPTGREDVNRDGVVDIWDVAAIAKVFGQAVPISASIEGLWILRDITFNPRDVNDGGVETFTAPQSETEASDNYRNFTGSLVLKDEIVTLHYAVDEHYSVIDFGSYVLRGEYIEVRWGAPSEYNFGLAPYGYSFGFHGHGLTDTLMVAQNELTLIQRSESNQSTITARFIRQTY